MPTDLLGGNKFGGNLAVEADSKNAYSAKVDVTAKIKFESKRVLGLKANAEVEGSAVDREVYFEDVYVDYKFTKNLKATLGYTKKILGREYEQGRKRRLTIHRSPLYKKMEELGLVGRQINLRLNVKMGEKKNRSRLSFAVGGDNSRNVNTQLSLRNKYKKFGFGFWSLQEYHRIDGKSIPIFAEAVSIWYENRKLQITTELFHGVDAQRTEFENYLKRERKVHFMGPKLDAALNIQLTERLTLTPLVQTSYIVDDLQNRDENTVHLLAGIKVDWRGLRVAFNAETFGVQNAADATTRDFNRRGFYGEIVYFF